MGMNMLKVLALRAWVEYLLKYQGQVPREVPVARMSPDRTRVWTQARLSLGVKGEGRSSKN